MLSSLVLVVLGQQLAAYEEPLPDALVKISMQPVPAGKLGSVEVKAFWIGKTEITWDQYDAFIASGPPSIPYDQTQLPADAVARPSKTFNLPDLGWGHAGYPAINLSSNSAMMYCRWLSSVTKKKYRLATEIEWEYACRAGEAWSSDEDDLKKVAWFESNSEQTTQPVGNKAASKLGLFDMLGNAAEWATDVEGKFVLCGGSFRDKLADVSPAARKRYSISWQQTDPQFPKSRWWLSDGPFAGFRIVCEP